MAIENWYHAGNSHRPNRAVTSPDKSRVLVMGDSIAQGIYGIGSDQLLRDQLTQSGFDSQFGGYGGTGLLDYNPDTLGAFAGPLHNWCKQLNTRLGSYDPDIVVIWYRGNYKVDGGPGQPGIISNTQAYFDAWLAEANHMTNLARGTTLAGNTRQVIWGLGPAQSGTHPTEGYDYDVQTRGVSSSYETISVTYKRTGYVDAYKHLPDPRDASSVFDPDGVHLTAEGYLVLANALVDRLIPNSL